MTGEGWTRDLRAVLRSLRRDWRFALPAMLTLAVGIGPNTAIFSAVQGLLLAPVPFAEPGRLLHLAAERGGVATAFSFRELEDMRAATRAVFSGIAGYTDQGQYNASGEGRPEELVSTITTHDLFSVLGVAPRAGAAWTDTEDRTRGFNVVISHGLWQRRFGGATDIVGRTMTLDGSPGYTILGVMPPGFAFPLRADLYRSHGIAPEPEAYEDRSDRNLWGVARLRDGVTLAQASAALAEAARRIERDFPATNTGITWTARPLRDLYVGATRPYLLLLVGAVALVLLVVTINVATLQLMRAVGREREVAVRLALGASRGVVLRLAILEGVVLATGGAVLGAALGALVLRGLQQLIRLDAPLWHTITFSWEAVAFTGVVALVAGLACSVGPALAQGRGDLTTTLKAMGRSGTATVRQSAWRSGLVVAEVGLAVALLVGAGYLVRSFRQLVSAPGGFRSDGLLTWRVELGWRAYPGLAPKVRFHRGLAEQLAALPGVRGVGLIDNPPYAGRPTSDRLIVLRGQDVAAERGNPFVNVRAATPDAMALLEVPLVAGRRLLATDTDSSARVVLVGESLARRLWPGRDPLGQAMLVGSRDSTVTPWRTVVGVVKDVRHDPVSAGPSQDVWLPLSQYNTGGFYVLVRGAGSLQALAARAPEVTWSVDPNQSFFDVRTMDERMADRVWVPRLASTLFAGFGALTILVAAVGLAAVLGYAVAQRARELGVRQALGATPQSLSRLVVADGLRLVALGGAGGVLGAIGMAAWQRHLLPGVGLVDLPSLAVVLLVVGVAGATAAWIPARRATRISPLEAIRGE